MTPERYRQIGELYHAALEVDAEERAAFLDRACAGDEEMLREVESLIASHEEAADFIAEPALAVAAGLLADGPTDALIGQLVSRYKIVSLIGAGGMGQVYLAEDTELGRSVALKLLPEHFTNDSDRVRRFRQEARAASALNHPNIITIHEIGKAGERHYIATEFIDGETLRARLEGGRLRQSEALDVATQMASALAAAHDAGIIHRDVKPENVMIRRDGYVKVLDFGLAKLTERPALDAEGPTVSMVRTDPGSLMGTVTYMSPEQARGLKLDARTDVWSLGVVVYEMITGRRPFEGATPSDVIVSILEREQGRLTQDGRQVSTELERIVAKALTKNTRERYQTAKEMAIDLMRLRRRLDVDAEIERSGPPSNDDDITANSSHDRHASSETNVQKTARINDATLTTSRFNFVSEIKKHKSVAALSGLTLLLLLGGLGNGLYQLLNRPAAVAAPFTTTNVSRLTATGRAKLAAISPDGKYVVYAQQEDKQQGLWVKQVATGSSVQIVPPSDFGFYWGLTFSNDSNYVYYVKTDRAAGGGAFNKLFQIPSLGGVSKKLMDQVDSAVAFSPDGQRFAFVRDNLKKEDTEIVLANADGRGEQTLAVRKAPDRFASDVATRIAWSPDGTNIACAAVSADRDGYYQSVVAVSVQDGSQKLLTSQRWSHIGQVAWRSDGSGLVMVAIDDDSIRSSPQLWHLSYPGGKARKITNDLNRFSDVSLTANAGALVTVQTNRVSNIWVAPKDDESRARQITSGTYDGSAGLAWTPDGRIVYTSESSGKQDIWMMNVDGTNQKRLTHEGQNGRPTVSHDGRHILFHSLRAGRNNIWRMDADGGGEKQLTDGKSNTHGSYSADDRWVIYISRDHGNGTVWKMPIDGGTAVQLSGPTANLPSVSPDGKQIVCFYWDEQANPPRGAMIIPFEGGGMPTKRFNLSSGGMVYGFVLHWTLDGRDILFIDTRNIWSQPLDGGEPQQLTNFQGDQIFNFDYSPDGKWLAAARGSVTSDVVLISDVR